MEVEINIHIVVGIMIQINVLKVLMYQKYYKIIATHIHFIIINGQKIKNYVLNVMN